MDDQNPVVLQISGKWHIVEHSRRSTISLCGKIITNRGAHATLSVVGQGNVCARCLRLYQEASRASDIRHRRQ